MTEPRAGSLVPLVWKIEQIDGVWFVVRGGVWPASVRITQDTQSPENDLARAERVCAVLNRVAK